MNESFLGRIKKYLFGDSGQSFVTWLRSGLPYQSKSDLAKEYKGLVYNAVNTISNDIGRYQPIFYKKREDEEVVVKQHPLLRLIEKPDQTMTQFELFKTASIDIEIYGEIFWYFGFGKLTKYPRTIKLLPPDRMTVSINQDTGEVAGYTMLDGKGNQVPFTIDEVYLTKTPNPMNPYRGLGTLEAALLYSKTEEEQSVFQYNFMKNQATPSGVLTFKENISEPAFKEIQKKWKERNSGSVNAGKTLFLRGGDAKFEKIGLSLADLDMGGLQKLTEDKVYRMFNVPRAILGETDSSGLGRSNIETIEYIFAKKTIDPKMDLIDDSLTMILAKYYGNRDKDKIYTKHVSQVPADKEAILKEHTAAVGKWMTRNEIRKERGLDPVDGGDDLYVGFNEVPVRSQDQKEEAIKSVTFTKKTKPVEVVEKAEDTDTKEREDAYFKQIERIETKGYNKYNRKFKSLLKEQRDTLIELISPHVGKKFVQKTYDELMPKEEEEAKRFAEAFILIMLATMQESGEVALAYLNAADLEFLVDQGTRNAIFESTERLIRSFTKETVDKLQKQLADGLANNESLKEITSRIESVYKEAAGYRAERIANTEVHKATNQAVADAYKQTGVKRVRWEVTEPDPCPYCLAMAGRVVTIGSAFVPKGGQIEAEDGSVLMNDYEDIKYADAHPNCKCILVPIIE